MKPIHEDDRLPWQRLMEIALGVLGFSPAIFWSMTPPEWMAAFAGWKRKYGIEEEGCAPSINRRELEQMIQGFPDIMAQRNCRREF